MIRKLLYNVFMDSKYASIIIRIWTILILTYTAYKGYILGWTKIMIPSEISEFNSWSARTAYANKGLEALLHLNIISILMATSLIVVPVILYIFVFKSKTIFNNNIYISLSYATLTVISIYTFMRIDTTNNYYGSRYFLPILVPLLITLFAIVLSKVNSKILLTLTFVAVITFNFYYDLSLFKKPVFQNRFQVIKEIANNIPAGSYVFLNGDTFSQRLLILPLSYLNNLNVICLNYNDNENLLADVKEQTDLYAENLGIENAYVISTKCFKDEPSFSTINFKNIIHPWMITYPTMVNEQLIDYYLYKLRYIGESYYYDIGNNDNLYVSNMYDSESNRIRWTKEKSEITLNINSNEGYIMTIKVCGFRPIDDPAKVMISMNENEIGQFEKASNEAEYKINIPKEFLKKDGYQVLQIETNTFKPSEYLNSTDSRDLGIQIDYVVLDKLANDR